MNQSKHYKYRGMKIEDVREQFIIDYGTSMNLIELKENSFYLQIFYHNTIRVLVFNGIVTNTNNG